MKFLFSRKFNKTKALRVAVLLLVDIVIINVSAFFALLIRYEFVLSNLRESGFLDNFIAYSPVYTLVSLTVFAGMRLYNSMWEFAGVDEMIRVIAAAFLSVSINAMGMWITQATVPRSFPIISLLLMICMLTSFRGTYRFLRRQKREGALAEKRRTMIVGAGSAGAILVRELSRSSHSGNKAVCLIDDDKAKWGSYLNGVLVAGGREKILEAAKKYRVDDIVLAIPSASFGERRQLLNICGQTGCRLKTLPAIYQLVNGEVSVQHIRNVEIEELLGRDSVQVDLNEISAYVKGKRVLITGGGGSIGSELCRQLAKEQPEKLIVFEISENNAYQIQQELKMAYPALDMEVVIGSVRDKARVDSVFERYRPHIVYHAAAHKHVPLMEDSPNEAVKNNIFGTYHVAEAAHRFGVSVFTLISTDKAVNPTNVMGASKRVCEMIVQDFAEKSSTKFAAVRFGNVLGSSGSVIPLFRKQIEKGGPVTVTHKDIIRYFMTIPEAVSLVIQAGAFAAGGEIFILDMGEPVRIDDLARNMIKLSGYEPDVDIKIVYTGLRPGEKLYEELLLSEEGLQKTRNDLIYVGHRTDFTSDQLKAGLKTLSELREAPLSEVQKALRQLVPTYQEESAGDIK